MVANSRATNTTLNLYSSLCVHCVSLKLHLSFAAILLLHFVLFISGILPTRLSVSGGA